MNAVDADLLFKFNAIGRPAELKIVLELDGFDAGFKVIQGKWVRGLRWDILTRVMEIIEGKYNKDREEPLIVKNVNYRLENV